MEPRPCGPSKPLVKKRQPARPPKPPVAMLGRKCKITRPPARPAEKNRVHALHLSLGIRNCPPPDQIKAAGPCRRPDRPPEAAAAPARPLPRTPAGADEPLVEVVAERPTGEVTPLRLSAMTMVWPLSQKSTRTKAGLTPHWERQLRACWPRVPDDAGVGAVGLVDVADVGHLDACRDAGRGHVVHQRHQAVADGAGALPWAAGRSSEQLKPEGPVTRKGVSNTYWNSGSR